MSHRDHDYDEYVPRHGSGLPPAVIIAVVLAVLLLLGGLGVGAAMLFWTVAAPDVDDEAQPVAVPNTPPKAVYTRQQFRDLVLGKTPDEVIAAVGKPDHTQEDGSGVRWYYNGRTTDPADGKTDRQTQVIFKDGKVSAVNP